MSQDSHLRFFVVGAPRSGTVRLASILESHPDVAMLARTQWLLGISTTAGDGAGAREVPGDLLRSAPQLAQLGFGERDLEELAGLGDQPSLASVLERIATLFARTRGRSIVGDRTEHYLGCIPLVHAEWPEARILHVIRDGRRIARSEFAAGKVSDPCEAALRWEWSVRTGRQAGCGLPPGVYEEVRHEDLTRDAEATLAAVSDFLRLPPGWAPVPKPAGRDRSRRKTEQGDSGMDPSARELFEAVAGSLLEELGYARLVARPGRMAMERSRRAREQFTQRRLLERHAPPAGWPDATTLETLEPIAVGSLVSAEVGQASTAPVPELDDTPRFFVVGAAESGTVRVGSVLESHPDVAMLVRTHWLLRLSAGEGIPGTSRSVAVDALLAAPELKQLGFGNSEREQIRALGESIPLGEVLQSVAALLAASLGRRVVGDRTERYLRCIEFLHSCRPLARIVHVIRDGRRIYRSMLTSGHQVGPCEAALDWEWHVRLGRQGGRAMPAGLYTEVRHEELLANPGSGYSSLCAFLGLPGGSELAEQHLRRINRGSGRSLAPLDREARELFEACAGSLLDELGLMRSVRRPGLEAAEAARQARIRFTRARLVNGDPLPADWPTVEPDSAGGRFRGWSGAKAFGMATGAFGKRQRSAADLLRSDELPADPAFPQMAELFDPDLARRWLEDATGAGPGGSEAWQVGFVRYRPARDLVVGYQPSTPRPDGTRPLLLVSAVGRQDLDRRRRLSGLEPAPADDGAPAFHYQAEASVVVTAFPDDPVFDGIAGLLDPDRLQASLARAWTDRARLVRDADGADIEVASYKPSSSCLVRCGVIDPDGRRRSLFARTYRDEAGAWVHRVMTALWERADEHGAGLARAVGYDPDSRTLFQEAAPGKLLTLQADLPALAARVATPLLATHATEVPESQSAPVDDPVERLSLAAVGLRAAVPEVGRMLDDLVTLLGRSRPDGPRVLIHGDFSPNQVLVAGRNGDSVTILDFDLARLGDRHADVASFMTRLEAQDLPADMTAAASHRFREAYESEAGALDDDTLDWYRATVFASMALYAVKALRPGWKKVAVEHLARAIRMLES